MREYVVIGYAEEAFTISKLMLHGWNCARPYAPEAYDIIATKKDKVIKIQVKLIGKLKNGIHIVSYRARDNKKYNLGDFDYFIAVHMKKDHCYILPFSFIAGKNSNRVYYGKSDLEIEQYLDNWSLLDER